VSEIAHAKGAMVYADIIQAAGNQPLDLTASGVDAAACATYKWLMSSGTAFLHVRKSSMQKMLPGITCAFQHPSSTTWTTSSECSRHYRRCSQTRRVTGRWARPGQSGET
jgi:selenocysteine lyase/cysteine desulfurase